MAHFGQSDDYRRDELLEGADELVVTIIGE